ncbi:MAG: aldehyde dehydrogenase family protein [Pseudomonadota bacterium]
MIIDGETHRGAGASLALEDPATGETIAQIDEASAEQAEAAIASANKAFAPQSAWRTMSPAQRERLLHGLTDAIEAHGDELAELITWELGAPLGAARHFEVNKAIETFRYYAGYPTKLHGHTVPLGHDFDGEYFAYTALEPVGVVAAIIPWNAPLMLAAWKLAPALAAGCTVVLKPSEDASLAVLRLVELANAAGFPPGVINCVAGKGASVGQALLAADGVDKYTFTGSTSVGRQVHQAASRTIARTSLELGGKSPSIVLEDADIAAIAPALAMSAFANSGQVCVAASRVFAHHTIADQLGDALAQFAATLTIGSGFDPAHQIGPLVSERQLDRVSNYVDTGINQEGGSLVFGGARHGESGYFFTPTIIAQLPDTSALLREEIFGPVLTLETYDDPLDVCDIANTADMGLAACVWGRDHAVVQRLARDLRVGTVFINTPPFPPANIATGGFRQSGMGRDLGTEGVLGFLEPKSVIDRIGPAA